MESAKEKLDKIASKKTSPWLSKATWRAENEGWLNYSFTIAVKVLSALRTQKISQKELADILNVSPQQVNKIVKGSENLTLETISKLEKALGIGLIKITDFHYKSPVKKRKYS